MQLSLMQNFAYNRVTGLEWRRIYFPVPMCFILTTLSHFTVRAFWRLKSSY